MTKSQPLAVIATPTTVQWCTLIVIWTQITSGRWYLPISRWAMLVSTGAEREGLVIRRERMLLLEQVSKCTHNTILLLLCGSGFDCKILAPDYELRVFLRLQSLNSQAP